MAQVLHIRRSTPVDIDGIAACHTRSIRKAYENFLAPSDLAIFTESQTTARVLARFETSDRISVALNSNKVVGYARSGEVEVEVDLWPYKVLVHALFIDPEFQGHGVGRAMLRQCLGEAEAEGYEGVMIGAFIENKPALDWYTRLGGRTIEVAPLEVGMNEYPCQFFAFDDLGSLATRMQ